MDASPKGTCIKPAHAILNGVARGQDKDWNTVAAGPRFSKQRQPIAIGKSKVEDRRIVVTERQCLAAVGAGPECVDDESSARQRTRHQLTHATFVFDQQNAQRFVPGGQRSKLDILTTALDRTAMRKPMMATLDRNGRREAGLKLP